MIGYGVKGMRRIGVGWSNSCKSFGEHTYAGPVSRLFPPSLNQFPEHAKRQPLPEQPSPLVIIDVKVLVVTRSDAAANAIMIRVLNVALVFE